jgi:electron transport complex protein RnfD
MKEGIKNGENIADILKEIPAYVDLFLGKIGGSTGEVAAVALLIGFVYLLARKIISWHIPVSILLTVTVFTGILWLANPEKNPDPLFHLLSGGLMLGAIFMATDYVTSPMNVRGMWIYGVMIGIITVIIRVFGSYPEGVQFAILIMNAFTPLINRYVKPRRFGEKKGNG